ncbi:hypothetical protein GCM10010329_28040 [Streptomyces spiroverticillatus]|uniref:Uncharacterized protein n=1 Tax=Streptomyces finlayi TaxID=67296 RepID=A0A919C9N0_9ACTN|nr:hypothetical protein [Streptomyces finlayi]GHA03914.1 hypothetical protein GCM10010329_28040 [Streptomyces spiroverticillatus]GHC88043.1 hypothetical protein GCM10010334_20450 [Streptomyces finlayi]
MSKLLRTPRECASWEWELDDFAPPGLESALMTAARMSVPLREHGLLEPTALKWPWYVHGAGGIGLSTQLNFRGGFDVEKLAQQIRESRPIGFPEAQVGNITISGFGTWIDATGAENREYELVRISVDPDERSLSADLSVFHDIWGRFDFSGFPHPEVQERNAPRLASALQELDALLGKADPGEATYFGRAQGYGIGEPDVIDGRGPDLTDQL